MKHRYAAPWLLLILALALFIPLFLTGGIGAFGFWEWMSFNAAVLVCAAMLADRRYAGIIKQDIRTDAVPKVAIGLVSAAALYVVFAVGNMVCNFLPFAKHGVQDIYNLRQGTPAVWIAVRLIVIIGPGEELLWRGYFQRVFWQRYGVLWGFVIATFFYFAMHIPSMNIMLLVASGVCGVFWAWLYIKYKSVLINIISHTTWDLAVFLLFPFA